MDSPWWDAADRRFSVRSSRSKTVPKEKGNVWKIIQYSILVCWIRSRIQEGKNYLQNRNRNFSAVKFYNFLSWKVTVRRLHPDPHWNQCGFIFFLYFCAKSAIGIKSSESRLKITLLSNFNNLYYFFMCRVPQLVSSLQNPDKKITLLSNFNYLYYFFMCRVPQLILVSSPQNPD